MKIYLDRYQCAEFGVEYYQQGTQITACAKMVVDSKGGDGYDDFHMSILQPYVESGSDLVLRQSGGPGWFEIISVVE